jgi:hypothetical protein
MSFALMAGTRDPPGMTPRHPEEDRMSSTIAIRAAHDDEAGTVLRLAALDSAPAPRGDVLLAVVDGEPVAAVSLHDGRVVADPFRRTDDVVALLRLRASMVLEAQDEPRRRPQRPRARLAALSLRP